MTLNYLKWILLPVLILFFSYAEAIKLDPNDKLVWFNKGNAFYN